MVARASKVGCATGDGGLDDEGRKVVEELAARDPLTISRAATVATVDSLTVFQGTGEGGGVGVVVSQGGCVGFEGEGDGRDSTVE